MRSGCYLRAVQEADKGLLFEWTNDEETRLQSFSQKPVTWEEHTEWFARTQADEACRHFILMVPGNGHESAGQECAVGVLWLVRDGVRGGNSGAYRISYSIAPVHRGHGYGTAILELAKAWMIAECPDCMEIYGEVKAGNAASIHCFERAGYRRAADSIPSGTSNSTEDGGMPFFRFYAELTSERILYFRADGGEKTGIGHLMRCFTIADACREKGMQAVFVTAEEEAGVIARKRGYPCRVLNTDYRNMDAELPKLMSVLREHAPVVLDSYFLTEQYVNALRKNGHPVVWMDDLAEQGFAVDIRINYNLYAEKTGHIPHIRQSDDSRDIRHHDKAGGCIHLYGPSYAPVRRSFWKKEKPVREQLMTVLVMTGGSDPLGAGMFFSRLLIKLLPDAELLVVLGPYAERKEELRAYAKQEKKIEVIEGCSDLSDVMRRCDLAVTAAGSTIYELCASGLPTIVYYMADNQRMGAEAFARRTGAVNLGDLRSDSFQTEAPKKLEAALLRYSAASERRNLSRRMNVLVDGKGAERIAEKIGELAHAPSLYSDV